MASSIKLVRNDTRPAILCTLLDDETADPLDLTGATVVMYFRYAEARDLQATITATILNAAAGEIVFFPATAPEMLQGDPGPYQGQIEVTFSDGQVHTLYDIIRFTVREDFDAQS